MTYAGRFAAVSDLVPDEHVPFAPEHLRSALRLVDHRRHGAVATVMARLQSL